MTRAAARTWEHLALAAWLALLALQPAWHGWLAPPAALPRAWVVIIATVPIALPLLALRRSRERALLLASIVALAYFCHGVMEAWAAPTIRALAATEILLALALIVATGTVGMLARRAVRRAPYRPTPSA